MLTRPGVVLPVRPDPAGVGGPTPDQARGPHWRRASTGLYVPSAVDATAIDQRIVEAVAGAPDGSAATGWAALAWQGARWFAGRTGAGEAIPVPVALGDKRAVAARRGVVHSHDWLFDGDVVEVDGLPITVPERSVTYAARRARTVEQATQVICMAMFDDLVDAEGLQAYAERLVGRPGVARLGKALGYAGENVWSPMEVTMAFRWSERMPRGWPRPLHNVPIFDRTGRHLVTPDLFDPGLGVAGEYDGVVHDGAPTRRRDLHREEVYREHGLEVVTMVSTDLRDVSDFQGRLAAAYRRARSRPLSESWTLEQPDWWVDTSTVARRRTLCAQQRATWLRRRAS